ncbi:hypothetical protein ABEB36_003756 [Hypothenemus hampei]|uniref:Cell cycle checkpoint protein RAD1 n=1 Tax=Hypothenemus hampei TaxID=57062 RepID=A0ABD1F1L9_HYPHA
MFNAQLTEVKTVCNMLKSIAIKEFAVFRPMEEGLKVTLEEMRCVETSAYIPREIFSLYQVKESEDNLFKINLKTFTDVINIFGDDINTTLKLSFNSPGSPLRLIVSHAEDNVFIECEMKTLNINEFESPSLAEECNLNKIVVNANIFVELLQRLDNSADELKIVFQPDFPYFSLKAKSLSGDSEVALNKNSDSVLVFQCNEQTDFTYAFSNIRHILKVMHYANKVAISTGSTGLLGLQLVIENEQHQMYVEYYVTSLFSVD